MKHTGSITQIIAMLLLIFLFSGCIRKDLEECPPLRIVLSVEDKNYENIDDAEALGLLQPVDENLPFKHFVRTLHYVITDTHGRVVFQYKGEVKDATAREVETVLPASLPYGNYRCIVWGNLQQPAVFSDVTEKIASEASGSKDQDVYLASATIDYRYGSDVCYLGMKRTKGNLLILAENVSDQINHSTKEISNLFQQVDWGWNYDGAETKQTQMDWNESGRVVSQTLTAPSIRKDATRLQVRFLHRDTGNSQPIQPEGFPLPDDVNITMSRNRLTIMRYEYHPDSNDFMIYIYVNDEWQRIHNMEID